MNRHAYLITAHQQFSLLKKLLTLLDDERHDFYIHIDGNSAPDFDDIKSAVRKSGIFFVERVRVQWGGYSQIQSELNLLKAAVQGGYSYYHLISGADLPLKSNDEIYDFFENRPAAEYLQFSSFEPDDHVMLRIRHYHPWREKPRNSRFYNLLRSGACRAQRLLRVDRLAHCESRFGFGANWFSITHDFAQYALAQEPFIRKYFRSSSCADELFLQSVLLNSPFFDRAFARALEPGDYHAVARMIDWNRGNPYTYRMEDYDLLMNSDFLFARKFDADRYPEVIDAIFEAVLQKNQK